MGKTILVSAGHSTVKPKDSGATGNGFTEANETLKMRDAVAKILRGKKLTVLTDGEDGESESLKKAIALVKKADVAVEIHFNSNKNSGANGIEVLAKKNHKALAQKLAGAVERATKLKLRGDKGYAADDSGQHKRLGFCNAGGLSLEVCFITNLDDMKAYQANSSKIATNLADILAAA